MAAAGALPVTWKELCYKFDISDSTLNGWHKQEKVPPKSRVLVKVAVDLGGDEEEWDARWRRARKAHDRLLADERARRQSGLKGNHRTAVRRLPPPPAGGRGRPWPERVLVFIGLIGVLALSASTARRPVFSPPQAAQCSYVTGRPATVFAHPSSQAKPVKSKDLGDGVEILRKPHPPGWVSVYTPRNRPGYNWMHANVLSAPVQGTRPCQDHNVATLEVENYNSAEEQFYVGSDCRIYHRWQHKFGGPFSGWGSLGGCALNPPELAVVMNGDSELVAFVIYSDHTVRYKSQPGPALGPWPSVWTSLGRGDFYGGLDVVTGASGSSLIKVFADDKAGHVWENDQVQGNQWSGWRRVQRP
jgi:hypothetical protein